MILADSSAWIEYDRATESPVDLRLTGLVEEGRSLAVTEPVFMEVLAGALRAEHEQALRRLLLRFDLLAVDPPVDFDSAARIHRMCRRAGITPRGLLDCLIVSVAQRHGAVLLARDRDIVGIARVVGVQIDPASSPP